MIDARTVRDIAARLRIAHHIPGRVRLKLDGNAVGLAGVGAAIGGFIEAARTVPGIRAVTLNPFAQSCLVEYDSDVICPSAWQDLIDGTRSDLAEVLVHALTAIRT